MRISSVLSARAIWQERGDLASEAPRALLQVGARMAEVDDEAVAAGVQAVIFSAQS